MILLKGHVSKNRIGFYNIDWRVWDSNPTDDERKDTSWDMNILKTCPVCKKQNIKFYPERREYRCIGCNIYFNDDNVILKREEIDSKVTYACGEWMDPIKIGCSHNKLYLAYQPGYPMMIVDFTTGHGLRDIRTRDHVEPIKVAEINLPRIDVK